MGKKKPAQTHSTWYVDWVATRVYYSPMAVPQFHKLDVGPHPRSRGRFHRGGLRLGLIDLMNTLRRFLLKLSYHEQ